MACGARSGLKPSATLWLTVHGHVGMACGARSGLKPYCYQRTQTWTKRRNGLWSPFGIETLKVLLVKLSFC